MKSTIPARLTVAAAAMILLVGCNRSEPGSLNSALLTASDRFVQTAPPMTNVSVPVIESFTADASAVTKGQSTQLSWRVVGESRIVLEPSGEALVGDSIVVTPEASTTYVLTASNDAGSSSHQVTVVVREGAGDWQVSEAPPKLINPKRVDVSKIGLTTFKAQELNCGGSIRSVRLDDNQDALIYMSGNKSLRHPLWVTGGRNVRIVGLQIELATQPGCGVGELPNRPVSQFPNSNIHPRVPSGMALRVQQSKVTFMEGLNIDVQGHQADCIVSRNPNQMSESLARKQRDVVVQNTYCSGIEGMGKTNIGDGVHGDFFQNQGRDPLRRLVFENVSMRTSQEGIVLHGGISGPGTQSLVVRRYDYTWDPRFVGDDAYDHRFGLAFVGWPSSNWTLENVRIDDYGDGLDYLKISDQRYGSFSKGKVVKHPEIKSGLPPQGAFALPERTGINYRSPHGGVP